MRHLLIVLTVAFCHTLVAETNANVIVGSFAGIDVDEVRSNQTIHVSIKEPIGPFNRALVTMAFNGITQQVLCHAYFSDMVMLSWTVSQMEALIPDVCKRFDCKQIDKNTDRAGQVRWTFKMNQPSDWRIELTAMQMKRRGKLPSRNLATLSLFRGNCMKEYDVEKEAERVPIPKEPPKGDIGCGQDEKWVRATFPEHADMILKMGYEKWLMEWVGIMRQNGHCKEMVHVGTMTNKSVELYLGPYRVHVVKPGIYSFPIKVFDKYDMYTEPPMELTSKDDQGFRSQEWFYKKAHGIKVE